MTDGALKSFDLVLLSINECDFLKAHNGLWFQITGGVVVVGGGGVHS